VGVGRRPAASTLAFHLATPPYPSPQGGGESIREISLTQTNDAGERLEVRSSRLWALFHFNLTRLLFPLHMAADRLGVSTSDVKFWLTPWQRTDEHLPLSHIAEVTHTRGFFWDAVSVESSGGANPLWIIGVSKSSAHYFVEHVRERLNESIPAPQQPRR
jgi:hypothetical protein